MLRSCSGASLDMLEAAIQNAVGTLPPMTLSMCEKCKGVFFMPAGSAFIFCVSLRDTVLLLSCL